MRRNAEKLPLLHWNRAFKDQEHRPWRPTTMLLEANYYALGGQLVCSWRPTSMLLEANYYALGGRKQCLFTPGARTEAFPHGICYEMEWCKRLWTKHLGRQPPPPSYSRQVCCRLPFTISLAATKTNVNELLCIRSQPQPAYFWGDNIEVGTKTDE